MLHNYLKMALRTLHKQKVYSSINVFGLALGIACCILMLLFVQHEWLHDRFHERSERIYRVIRSGEASGSGSAYEAELPAPLGPALRETFPDAEQVVRIAGGGRHYVAHEDRVFEEVVHFADPSVFEVFTFPLAPGNPATVLTRPDGAVVSRRTAQKLFGTEDPLGRSFTIQFLEETQAVVVTGVLEDPRPHSSLQFDVLLPFAMSQYTSSGFFREMAFTSWKMPYCETFVLLPDGGPASSLEAKLPGFVAQHFDDDAAFPVLALQPLAAVHLDPTVEGRIITASNPRYSYVLLGIALLVLCVACINFVTLAVGRAGSRGLEIGVRKVVGASRGQIRVQFWGEALLTSSVALLLGIALAQLAVPAFSKLAGEDLALRVIDRGVALAVLVALTLLIGLLAGSYPALVLSRFTPVSVLKGAMGPRGQSRLTRVLVVVQFGFSTALLIGTFFMARQLDYLRITDLGFDREQVVVLRTPYGNSEAGAQLYETLRTALSPYEAIEDMTSSFFVFGEKGFGVDVHRGDTVLARASMEVVDLNFLDFMGLGLVEGRAFDEDRGTDRSGSAVLINETLADRLGRDGVLGTELPTRFYEGMVVAGIVKDYHFHSLHHAIAPMILAPRTAMANGVRSILVRIKPDNIPQTLALLEEAWREADADAPFTYRFLDDVVDQQYRAEARWGRIVRYASAFALLIACFGLFGLATLTATRRIKEIGIRKVLGATVSHVVLLLSKDLIALVCYAFALAAPLAYLAVRHWLDTFAYRIEISGWIFLMAGLVALLIAVFTVSYQAIRAALADPVNALRYE